ncbi:MAG: hypothetical protein NTX56_04685 [Proteobacteria bacterium]|nr:hypothetical protein [Pseudomonadota bacterium]
MSSLRLWLVVLAGAGLLLGKAVAQVGVGATGKEAKATSGNRGSPQVSAGVIGSDVQIEGIAVINGEVFIDGEQVPRGKVSYTSKKTGKSYRIQWGKDGNVSVSEI